MDSDESHAVFPIRLHLHTASTRLGEESGVLGNVCISSQQHLNTHFLLFVSVNVNNTVLRFIINAGMSVWLAFLPYWRYSIYITCVRAVFWTAEVVIYHDRHPAVEFKGLVDMVTHVTQREKDRAATY